MARKMKVPLNLLTLSSNPTGGTVGDVYFNTATKNIRIYNGLEWVDLTPASSDPAPFYMHTHTYDGEVHTIDVGDQIKFNQFNPTASVTEQLPVVVGLDGGTPFSIFDPTPTYGELTLLDGGEFAN